MQDYDLEALLEHCDVPYRVQGKNITSGWLGIPCPFCKGKGFHLGINRTGYGFFCWQCGEKGYITKLIKEILNLSKGETYGVLSKFELGLRVPSNPETHIAKIPPLLPLKKSKWGKACLDYARSRKLILESLEAEYGIYESNCPGKYKGRIIIPIHFNRKLVCFVGRDYTGKREPKYLNSPADKSIIPVKQTLYGIDDAHPETAILVEGPVDRWRLGKEAMALMGKTISDNQVRQLFEKKFKEVFIILDSNEEESAEKIANKVRALVNEVNIVSLKEGDPGDLTEEQASYLMKEITTRKTYI